MAPRANWKGFLRLSLVTCPVALYPATSESEKISFNQLNRTTGHRIKYVKVDADTGEEVPNEDIVKGYELEKGQYIEVSKEELEEIALESTRTIEIDEFVDKAQRRPRSRLCRPHFPGPIGFGASQRLSRGAGVRRRRTISTLRFRTLLICRSQQRGRTDRKRSLRAGIVDQGLWPGKQLQLLLVVDDDLSSADANPMARKLGKTA